MLQLNLQYFSHLVRRADSLGKTLTMGKMEGKRRSGWRRMRWLNSITDSMDINLREHCKILRASLVAQTVKASAYNAGDPGSIPGLNRKIPLEKEMATHSSILAWKIPWTEEPSRLQSMRSQRVGCDLVIKQHHS